MHEHKNTGLKAIFTRLSIRLLVLIGSIVVLEMFIYLGIIGNLYNPQVKAAYYDSYREGYAETYDSGYKEGYLTALFPGYMRASEVQGLYTTEKRTGVFSTFRIPTYPELKRFLMRDTTDENAYIEDVYMCFEYTADLVNNAEANGIRAAYVSIRGDDWAHALVAFKTQDRDLVFIEPQSDRVVYVEVGKPYPWLLAGATSTPYMDKPVEEIRIIW